MRHRVLLIAAELDLRARFARELHSSGYAVELACDLKRALTLAAAGTPDRVPALPASPFAIVPGVLVHA